MASFRIQPWKEKLMITKHAQVTAKARVAIKRAIRAKLGDATPDDLATTPSKTLVTLYRLLKGIGR